MQDVMELPPMLEFWGWIIGGGTLLAFVVFALLGEREARKQRKEGRKPTHPNG